MNTPRVQRARPSGQTPVKSHQERQRAARAMNALIDRALLEPGDAARRAVLRLHTTIATPDLAERVRRRGTLLALRDRAHDAQLLQARDRLVLALYAHATPAGWHTAWCDGSVAAGAAQAGIGGLLRDPAGRTVLEFARRAPVATAFEAEIAALVAALEAARAKGARRLRVYSDCAAAAQLWHRNRDDPRLAALAALARRFRRIEICTLPRTHNLPAHRLARLQDRA